MTRDTDDCRLVLYLWRMRFLVPAVAILVLCGAIADFVNHEFVDGSQALTIGLLLAGLYFYSRRELRAQREFLAWLTANAAAVRFGGAVYRDAMISPETVVRQFGVCMSALLVSARTSSRFLIEGHDPVVLTAIVSTGTSLLLGWWAIPWGPVYTITVFVGNVRGGKRQTVGQLLDQLAAQPQTAA